MVRTEHRLDGAVSIEVDELYIKLYWINDLGNSVRKAFKQKLLIEFVGKLVIDFRRKGGAVVMNDMVCVLQEDLDFDTFKDELVGSHERTRNGTATWNTPNRVTMHSPEKLGGDLTVSFYKDQRKLMAQAKPAPLKHFVTYYTNTVNKMSMPLFSPATVIAASQQPEIDPDDFEQSQEIQEGVEGEYNDNNLTDASLVSPLYEQETANTPVGAPPADIADVEVSNPTSPHNTPENSAESSVADAERVRLAQIEKGVFDTSETVEKSIFSEFQKIVMKELRDVKEDVKGVRVEIPVLHALKGKFDAMEYKYKLEVAELNADLLIQKEEVNRLKNSLNDAKKTIRNYKSSANGHAVEIGKLSDEISQIRLEIAGAHTGQMSGELESLSASVDVLKGDLESAKLQHDITLSCIQDAQKLAVASQQEEAVRSAPVPDKPVHLPAARQHPRTQRQNQQLDCVIDCDVLFIHDSNLYKLNEKIMQRNTQCQKILAYTVPQAIEIIQRATFKSIPRKILIHVGSNDVEYSRAMGIIHKYEELVSIFRTRCDGAEVYIDSILPRRDTMHVVNSLNELLVTFTALNGCLLVDNSNIKADMLTDRKHVNKLGFFLLLANIRLNIFG